MTAQLSEQSVASEPNDALMRRVGPLTVRASTQEVEAFRRETFAPADTIVPFTFPVRWFAHPDIRAAGESLLGPDGWIPLHELQSFDYERPLARDTDYRMTVDIHCEREPMRLILRAEIGDGATLLRSEMILRIIPATALDGGKP